MNTHDKYELPPLPNMSTGALKAAFEEYARAAIEPYAKRVAELEAARIAYASEFEPDENGEPDVGSIHDNIRMLKADRQRRGEPVAWLSMCIQGLDSGKCVIAKEGEPTINTTYWSQPFPVFRAPQPAEPAADGQESMTAPKTAEAFSSDIPVTEGEEEVWRELEQRQ